ncbi:MAG: hypothetical protein WA081_05940 [Desulfosalsimonadaceae bacterium]
MGITPEHAQLAGSWDVVHLDPFDRMLAAQAKLEGMDFAIVAPVMEIFSIKILFKK